MAGTIKLDGAQFLEKVNNEFKITNSELKLKSSGNTVVDSSGNAVLSESGGTVTLGNASVASTLDTTNLALSANNAGVKTALNASGDAPIYACRAWCIFDASSGTPTIRYDGNLSSITDNGVGDYTFNFTVAMPDNDFTTVAQGYGQGDHIFTGGVVSRTTSTVRMYFGDTGVVGSHSNTRRDQNGYGIAVFR